MTLDDVKVLERKLRKGQVLTREEAEEIVQLTLRLLGADGPVKSTPTEPNQATGLRRFGL